MSTGTSPSPIYGFGVRAEMYDPAAIRLPEDGAPQHARSEVLTVAPNGTLGFVSFQMSSLPRLLLAPAGERRLWRAETAAEAELMAARWTSKDVHTLFSWVVVPFAVPDGPAIRRIIEAHGLRGEMKLLAAAGRPFAGFDRCDRPDATRPRSGFPAATAQSDSTRPRRTL